MIKSHINNNTPLEDISKSSINRILKNKFLYSYKKANLVNKIWLKPDQKRRSWESIQVQLSILNLDYEIIYFDAFSWSNRHNTVYTWGIRGEKAFAVMENQTFSMSFLIAFSSQRFYGWIGTEEIFDSEKIIKFIQEILIARANHFNVEDSKMVFISDNAPIYVSKKVQKFLSDCKISMITILAYSPSLNPWEKVIGCIRAKIRSKMCFGR